MFKLGQFFLFLSVLQAVGQHYILVHVALHGRHVANPFVSFRHLLETVSLVIGVGADNHMGDGQGHIQVAQCCIPCLWRRSQAHSRACQSWCAPLPNGRLEFLPCTPLLLLGTLYLVPSNWIIILLSLVWCLDNIIPCSGSS